MLAYTTSLLKYYTQNLIIIHVYIGIILFLRIYNIAKFGPENFKIFKRIRRNIGSKE